MLSLVLITCNDGPAGGGGLRRHLATLAQALSKLAQRDQVEVILIDLGSHDDTLAELTDFAASQGGAARLIRLDTPDLDVTAQTALARAEARHPYVLFLDPGDHLTPAALPQLVAQLTKDRPDVMVLAQGNWVGDPDVILPAADAARATSLGADPSATDLLTLTPDPRRLLIHRKAAAEMPLGPPAQMWPLWETALTGAKSLGFFAPVLCHHRLHEVDATPALAAASNAHRLIWANDALYHGAPTQAGALITAAQSLTTQLTADQIAAAPAPLGPLLAALADGDPALAMAHLALYFAGQDRMHTTALAAAVTRLRTDLDTALPGPEYLRALYDRILAQ